LPRPEPSYSEPTRPLPAPARLTSSAVAPRTCAHRRRAGGGYGPMIRVIAAGRRVLPKRKYWGLCSALKQKLAGPVADPGGVQTQSRQLRRRKWAAWSMAAWWKQLRWCRNVACSVTVSVLSVVSRAGTVGRSTWHVMQLHCRRGCPAHHDREGPRAAKLACGSFFFPASKTLQMQSAREGARIGAHLGSLAFARGTRGLLAGRPRRGE
jgi:hypothetical protein